MKKVGWFPKLEYSSMMCQFRTNVEKYDNASNVEKQESVCLADGVTNRYSIWIDTIEKYTSNGIYRVTV